MPAALVVGAAGVVLSLSSFVYTFFKDDVAARRDKMLLLKELIQEYPEAQRAMQSLGHVRESLGQHAVPWYVRAYELPKIAQDVEASRHTLASFWDMVLELSSEGLLPREKVFPTLLTGGGGPTTTWLTRANKYRRLVEPLECANYHRLDFNVDSNAANGGDELPDRLRYTFQNGMGYTPDDNRPFRFAEFERMWVQRREQEEDALQTELEEVEKRCLAAQLTRRNPALAAV